MLCVLEFLSVGQVVDAIDEGSSGAYSLGYRTVGEEHELLDKVVRLVRGLKIDLRREAVLIESEAHLVLLDCERSVGNPLGAEFLRKGVKGRYRVHYESPLGLTRFRVESVSLPCFLYISAISALLYDLLRFVVVEARVGANNGSTDLIFEYPRVGIHREDDGETEFVFAGAEGAFVVAQFLGEHGQYAVHKIDGGSALVRVFICFRTRAHVKTHIRDVDADSIGRFACLFKRKGVIEVFGVRRIDGKSEHLAHISAA